MSRRIGVVGCRPPDGLGPEAWAEYARILDDVAHFVMGLPDDVVVVSGGARGVDATAVATAKRRGLAWKEHLPDYDAFSGVVAPKKRNEVLVADVTELVAWPGSWSRGTWHAVRCARVRGIPVTAHGVEPKRRAS